MVKTWRSRIRSISRRPLDIAFVVIFLLPIFILAMTYDRRPVRERGTWHILLTPCRCGVHGFEDV
jgi:hypothetical protein